MCVCVGWGGGVGGCGIMGFAAEDLNLFADLLVAPYGDAVVFGIGEDFAQYYQRGFTISAVSGVRLRESRS